MPTSPLPSIAALPRRPPAPALLLFPLEKVRHELDVTSFFSPLCGIVRLIVRQMRCVRAEAGFLKTAGAARVREQMPCRRGLVRSATACAAIMGHMSLARVSCDTPLMSSTRRQVFLQQTMWNIGRPIPRVTILYGDWRAVVCKLPIAYRHFSGAHLYVLRIYCLGLSVAVFFLRRTS